MRWAGRASIRKAVAVAAVGVAFVAGACGADSDAPPGTAAATDGGRALTIKDFAFSPKPLVVPAGTVVRIVNEDDAPHTATADDGAFDTGSLGRDESEDITLPAAGEFSYHCAIHDYMRGVIRVGG